MYTAIVLTEQCRDVLLKSFRNKHHVPSDWVTKAHHVTVNMGPWDEELNPKELMGSRVGFHLGNLMHAKEHGVIAYKLDGRPQVQNNSLGEYIREKNIRINIKNKHPHLTMFHAPDVKPVKSNHLLEQAARGEEAAREYGLRWDQGCYMVGHIVEVKDNPTFQKPCPQCGSEVTYK
jgi:NADH:ubiquinone oxidoreductase subunit